MRMWSSSRAAGVSASTRSMKPTVAAGPMPPSTPRTFPMTSPLAASPWPPAPQSSLCPHTTRGRHADRTEAATVLITNDAVVLGLLAVILVGLLGFQPLPPVGPALLQRRSGPLLCHSLPSLLTTAGSA